MSTKLNENTTVKFVEEYRSDECCWNVNNPLYKNNIGTVYVVYSTLAETINMSELLKLKLKMCVKFVHKN